jgi:hypothetical protein
MDNNNQTKGVDTNSQGFISVDSNSKTETKSSEFLGGDNHGLRYIPTLIKSLEDHFSFTALLVSVVGYILISTFGKMDSVEKYFGYIIFLIFSFFLYKFLNSNMKITFWNKFFMYGFFILIILILLKYLTIIKSYISLIIK